MTLHRSRRIALERAGGKCERCGISIVNIPASVHHRRTRGMGGTKKPETPENLAVLCGTGTTGCHGWVGANPADAAEAGWYVHQWDDPETVPMTTTDNRQFILDGEEKVWLP